MTVLNKKAPLAYTQKKEKEKKKARRDRQNLSNFSITIHILSGESGRYTHRIDSLNKFIFKSFYWHSELTTTKKLYNVAELFSTSKSFIIVINVSWQKKVLFQTYKNANFLHRKSLSRRKFEAKLEEQFNPRKLKVGLQIFNLNKVFLCWLFKLRLGIWFFSLTTFSLNAFAFTMRMQKIQVWKKARRVTMIFV